MKPTKIIVAISGASGFKLGLKTYKLINKKYKKYLIVSNHAKIVHKKEDKKVRVNWEKESQQDVAHRRQSRR